MIVSEKKTVRFQQDLSSTKEESLHLLVRLKQMTDAKVNFIFTDFFFFWVEISITRPEWKSFDL